MAGTRRAQDRDVISRIADSGEDALRRLVELPRRIVGQAVDDVEERLHDLATKVRQIDPLYGRVAAIERRLDSLEKVKKASARKASPRAKPSSGRTASSALESEQTEHDRGLEHAETERGLGQARAENDAQDAR